MCGIFGIFRRTGLTPDDRWMLSDMAYQLRKRGPDGEGFFQADNVAIGMRRLAIIDLNGGWQPLFNEDKSLILVANGEIYNHKEIRNDLESKGHIFSTSSDSETILHLYEEYGLNYVNYLRGMFSFALIDLTKQQLHLVRDRMGEKPLAIFNSDDHIVFCSESSGLIASGAVPFILDPDGIRSFFHWHFIPEPNTAILNIKKLNPGSMLIVDLKSGNQIKKQYWNLEDAPPLSGDPASLISKEIINIGKLITQSDVPIGISLSGGIDSSAIAALAMRYSSQPVQGFTIGYEGVTWQDERSRAREFANHIGLPLSELRLTTDQVVEDFPNICINCDDPIVDISASGFHALFKMSHDAGVKVLLGGQGSDEIFWGYQWVREALVACNRKHELLSGNQTLLDYLLLSKPPLSVSGFATWVLNGAGLIRGYRDWKRDLDGNKNRLVFWDTRSEYQNAQHSFDRIAGDYLIEATIKVDELFNNSAGWSDLRTSLTSLMCKTFLQSNGLILSDRLSMSNSVEGRLPFTDYRLVEIAVGLNKFHDSSQFGHKAWLRSALSDILPEFVFKRSKRGFTPPWRKWSRAIIKAYGDEIANGELVNRGIIRRDSVPLLLKPFDYFGRQNPMCLATIVLEKWVNGMSNIETNGRKVRINRKYGELAKLTNSHFSA